MLFLMIMYVYVRTWLYFGMCMHMQKIVYWIGPSGAPLRDSVVLCKAWGIKINVCTVHVVILHSK